MNWLDWRFAGRYRGADPLGLRRVLGDRMLPLLVAAMAFLASLALGGAIAAQDWADRWRLGAGTALTAQVPRPNEIIAGGASRLDRALAVLRADPAVAGARALSTQELADLLGPWLGDAEQVPGALLPAVVSVRAALDPASSRATFRDLARRLASAVPEATLDTHEAWVDRLAVLLRALEASAWGALALVGAVASLVVATATRAGLSARRSTVTLLHGLGATDGYISGRFALRAMVLAAIGGSAGTLGAVPLLLAIARLGGAADPPETLGATLASLQPPLWVGLAALPVIAAAIGFGTAQGTVQLWLRRLP